MFVELVLGKARDTSRLRKAWHAVLPVIDALGDRWHGATAGTSDDGSFVGLLGFESEEGARNTLDHVATTPQWTELKGSLQDPSFHECPEVRAFITGDLSQADTIEITHGRSTDVARISRSFEDAVRAANNDSSVIAALWCWNPDEQAAMAIYRRSGGGRKAPPKATFDGQRAVDQPRVVTLKPPWSLAAFGTASAPRGPKGGRNR